MARGHENHSLVAVRKKTTLENWNSYLKNWRTKETKQARKIKILQQTNSMAGPYDFIGRNQTKERITKENDKQTRAPTNTKALKFHFIAS